LVENGAYLVVRRQQALTELDELAREIHNELTDRVEGLRLRYQPSVELDGQPDAGGASEAFHAQLEALHRREVAAGMTLVGPHRDEVRFLINKVDAGVYGSRGQQRTVTLALKLAEVDLMRRETGEHPVLLLDDVLSELDAHRRGFLVHCLNDGPQQAIITTTDLHALPETLLQVCQLWRVQMGRLSEMVTPAAKSAAPV
jgi:DNA replication and repair protein RecF